MGKPGRIRSEAVETVPQSREEASEAVAAIGRAQRERERIAAAMNDELAALRQTYEAAALPHATAIAKLSAGVQTWCEANREELTRAGKTKTVELASGRICWRWRPYKVTVRGVEAVLAALKEKGLAKFIRIKREVNRDAILAEAGAVADVPGITVERGEDFVIVPYETELEEVV